MKYIVSVLTFVLLASSCTSNFEDLNTNPDATTQVKSSMLATKVLTGMMTETYLYNEFLCKRMFWGTQLNYDQYNRFEHGHFGYLQRLMNAKKMMELASDADKNAYSGLFYFMKGWYFWRTTLDMGDIPYLQALDVETYRYPVYDEQKVVFLGILSDLEKAEAYFTNANTFEGDPFYNGNPEKWRKATNVLRLKVLMSLSKRVEDTPDLQVKESFARIVETGVLFQSNDDNLQVEYSDVKVEHSPWHVNYVLHINDWAATSMIIDPLKKYEDYRLFYYFEPAQAFTDKLYLPEGETLLNTSDWNAYTGLDVAAPWGEESKKIAEKKHSRLNDIYRNTFTGVPLIRLGYADMNFIIAEAIERGWLKGNAQCYYEEGIKASFRFVHDYISVQYNHGREITEDYIVNYLHGPYVSYKMDGTQMERLQQIWMQVYLARFFHSYYDDYYDYRRNGYPEYPISPNTNLNDEKDKIPMRWMYPENELFYNKDQYYAAIERQWGGTDNVNNLMWLLK